MALPSPAHTNTLFLIGLASMWVFWFGLGVVFIELVATGMLEQAKELARSVPYWGK